MQKPRGGSHIEHVGSYTTTEGRLVAVEVLYVNVYPYNEAKLIRTCTLYVHTVDLQTLLHII